MSNSLNILGKAESDSLREAYLDAFVDRSRDHYQQYISTKKRFSDGEHYTGYLWDNLRDGRRITLERFSLEIVKFSEIYVMADDHSRDRVMSAPLWPYPPYRVISLTPNLLLHLLPALPEDIYAFDAAVSWTLIRTHEYELKSRICIAAGLTA